MFESWSNETWTNLKSIKRGKKQHRKNNHTSLEKKNKWIKKNKNKACIKKKMSLKEPCYIDSKMKHTKSEQNCSETNWTYSSYGSTFNSLIFLIVYVRYNVYNSTWGILLVRWCESWYMFLIVCRIFILNTKYFSVT